MGAEVDLVVTCPVCGKPNAVTVNLSDYLNYTENNLYAQDAFPYLSAREREILISGICPKCWDDMFAEDSMEEE